MIVMAAVVGVADKAAEAGLALAAAVVAHLASARLVLVVVL